MEGGQFNGFSLKSLIFQMEKFMKNPILMAILVLALAVIFLYAGSNKSASLVAAGDISESQPISGFGSDADISEQSPVSNLSASPIKQVIRGVIYFGGRNYEVTQNLSQSIDPAKSVVLLSKCVEKRTSEPGYYTLNRSDACLISLTEYSITVAVDFSEQYPNIYSQRVSYQIIEYK
jgi:hypothetical protein